MYSYFTLSVRKRLYTSKSVYRPLANLTPQRSVPSCTNPSLSGIARLRTFSVAHLICTLNILCLLNAHLHNTLTASVISPLPWNSSASQYPNSVLLFSRSVSLNPISPANCPSHTITNT